MGYRIGESRDEVLRAHGPFVMAGRADPHTEIYIDDNFGMNPLRSWFVFTDGKLAALKMRFDNQSLAPAAVADSLRETYGPPSATETVNWVDPDGQKLTSTRLTWRTPSGPLQFDDKLDRQEWGAIQINPELIDSLLEDRL